MSEITEESKPLIEEAARPETSPDRLLTLTKSENFHIRHAVAFNPNTPPEALTLLLKDEFIYLRKVALRNPNITAHLIERVYQEEKDFWFVTLLAGLERTPARILEELAWSDADPVRFQCAKNFSTPVETLQLLSTDEDPAVREAVGRNLNTPLATLQSLSQDKNPKVRQGVASNPTASIDLICWLTQDINLGVQAAAVENLETQPVEKLAAALEEITDGETLPREWLLKLIKLK